MSVVILNEGAPLEAEEEGREEVDGDAQIRVKVREIVTADFASNGEALRPLGRRTNIRRVPDRR